MKSKLLRGIRLFGAFVITLFVAAFFTAMESNSVNIKPVASTVEETQKPSVEFLTEQTVEINSFHKFEEYVAAVNNGSAINLLDEINTYPLGKTRSTLAVKGEDGKIYYFTFDVNVVDTAAPNISVPDYISTRQNKGLDLGTYAKVSDNSGEQVSLSVTGEFSFSKSGIYNISYEAIDKSGNKSAKGVTLAVYDTFATHADTAIRTPSSVNTSNYNKPYAITVYRENGTVVVYSADQNGFFTIPVRVCVASPGADDNTPLGTFYTPAKYRWATLIGPCYGQYSTRISGPILFHSVPYVDKKEDTLKYWLYNRLGSKDSLGCVRLTVEDAKWIYDNCPNKTAVTITTDPLPSGIALPKSIKIAADSANKGWDPTDPNPDNPWKKPMPEPPATSEPEEIQTPPVTEESPLKNEEENQNITSSPEVSAPSENEENIIPQEE